MKDKYKELELFEDEGLAHRLDEALEKETGVMAIIADMRQFAVDSLSVVREHPVWTAGIGSAVVTAGFATRGITTHSRRH